MDNERIKFIKHENREILFLDFSNGKKDQVLRIIEDAKKVISTKPKNSVLTLTDVTNTSFNDEIGESMRELTAHNKPYVRAGAVVGITGLKKIIFTAVMAFSKGNLESFDDVEQAKSWLINN